METIPEVEKKKINFDPEKIKKFSKIVSDLQAKVMNRDDSFKDFYRLAEEIDAFATNLRNIYGSGVDKTAMWHVFGSTIDPNRYGEIEEEDFEDEAGKDVVKRFINYLVKKYG